jgi:tetratricopeptide (TPR) repeat protein
MHQESDPGRMSFPPGQFASGRYRIGSMLGRGGMGEVFVADDLTLGRKVAIKFLLADKTADPDARRRLLREAQAAAAVDHPGICTVYEAGETLEGRAFVVMQYVEGETLSSVLQRGPLPVRDTLALGVHLAEALGAAHRRGIVHRDLKPANVMMMPSGLPKLLDLGIAKVVVSATGASDVSTFSGATGPGVLVGTPGYMAPEQIQQRPLDGRCDLFSLGALLFECFTGHRAFQGSTALETVGNTLHITPPPPSTIRKELTTQHDELCRRLLAKDPDERFQSADEVVGAIRMLLPDMSRAVFSRRSVLAALTISIVTIGAATGGWIWTRPRALPAVPDDSKLWYDRGIEAIREGAYLSGQRALEESIKRFPRHALAHARLAEAYAELDDEQDAKDQLLHVANLVPNESRLPEIERLRLQAVRALVMREVDAGVDLYRQLVDRVSDESGAWLDLGRAQETAGLRSAARESYERAISQDGDYAAAYLRLGYVQGLESRRDEALAAFDKAERLYRAASDLEGETEVLLRRGALFEATGELKEARANLDRANTLAINSDAVYQQVRIQLALSSVAASEGKFAEAEKIASAAVQKALEHGLETVAADGLVNLAALIQSERPEEAARQVQRAIQLAERRGARRTAARARVQLAAVREFTGNSTEAIGLVDKELPFLQANRYRRLELNALSIKVRALESLDDLEQARQISSSVLSVAEAVKDDVQAALAAANLASVTTALGHYPEALRLREQAEAIRLRHGDKENQPYDMTNRADLLIRLGRSDEADRVLAEIDAGIAAKLPAYVGRSRRVAFLRAFAAATQLRCAESRRFVAALERQRILSDSAGVLAPSIGAFCDAHAGRHVPAPRAPSPETERTLAREGYYWLAAASLERGDARGALTAVARALDLLGKLSNDELRWRLEAIGALAAQRTGDVGLATNYLASARTSLERVRSAWKADFMRYEQRKDLVTLRKRLGLA